MPEKNELQNKCVDLVKKLDVKFKIDRNPQLCFTQMMEEVGELAKEINKPKLRNQQIDTNNLNGEMADVFIQLAMLAEMHDVNLNEAIESKIEEIEARHNL